MLKDNINRLKCVVMFIKIICEFILTRLSKNFSFIVKDLVIVPYSLEDKVCRCFAKNCRC